MKYLSTAPPTEPVHTFELTQTEVDVLYCLLADYQSVVLAFSDDDSKWAPTAETRAVLGDVSVELSVQSSPENFDYVSKFEQYFEAQ